MRLLVLALYAVTGCYRPEPHAGAACAAGGVCPTGLVCRAGICVDDGTPPIDGAVIDAPDARVIDAAPPDALDAVGCADGAREAFTDMQAFPMIAGCAASWTGALDLRAARTNQLCGDDLQLCAAPVDACSAGWHLCGAAGQPSELTARATEAQCATAGNAPGNARFTTALSHCSAYDGTTCSYTLPLPCAQSMDCSEPVCCGAGCRNDAGCVAGAYAATLIAGTLTNGCGLMLASTVTGVLCCR